MLQVSSRLSANKLEKIEMDTMDSLMETRRRRRRHEQFSVAMKKVRLSA